MTTTSHAVLGLLAIRPWSAYELAGQFGRSLSRFWPRAISKVYEEPNKLVEHGFATRHDEQNGRRSRSVYTITDPGRAELRSWLGSTSDATVVIEAEALLRVFLADQGRREDLRRAIDDVRAWAQQRLHDDAAIARSYLEEDGPFPGRLPYLTLVGAFSSDLAAAALGWADRADRIVAAWPEHAPPTEADRDLLTAIATRPDEGATTNR